jgi:hypothetical protein
MSMHPLLQVIPLQSFISSLPLTLLLTSEKVSNVVANIVTEIKARQSGHSRLTEPWVEYPLNEDQYRELLQQVQSDETVLGYVREELRQESSQISASNLS